MGIVDMDRVFMRGRGVLGGILLASLAAWPSIATARSSAQPPQQPKSPPIIGSIKAISAGALTLATDANGDVAVQFSPEIKILRVPPGSKDLKDAAVIPLSDLQPGDRILVRGKPGDVPGSFLASSIVAMKKADIAEKQSHERDEWQRRGTGGLVKAIDAASGAITISTFGATGSKELTVRVTSATILRRYAPGSVKFDDARLAPLGEIKPGDQLRTRGTRSADGQQFAADEVVSGTFGNIAGVVQLVDSAAGTLTVADIATKKSMLVKVGPDSQLRKLPQPMAQRIAERLKGTPAGAAPAGPPRGATSPSGGPPEGGGPGRNGGDLQQMLARLPASSLGDFQKGDAVMIVAIEGRGNSAQIAVTMLGGVEAILQAAPQGQQASILTPWSLGNGGGDAATP